MNRREFLAVTGAATLIRSSEVYERRVYLPGSVLPPLRVLKRNGITLVRRTGNEYTFQFTSLEERIRAWDCFNSDPDWCALRERGQVSIESIKIERRDQPGGNIFEMSL